MSLALVALLSLIGQIEDRAHDPVAIAEAANELRKALLVTERDPVHQLRLSMAIELERIVPIQVAALLRGVSVDTIARHFREHIILTGTKTRGIRIKHALGLEEGSPLSPKPRRKKRALIPARKRRIGQKRKATSATISEIAPT